MRKRQKGEKRKDEVKKGGKEVAAEFRWWSDILPQRDLSSQVLLGQVISAEKRGLPGGEVCVDRWT